LKEPEIVDQSTTVVFTTSNPNPETPTLPLGKIEQMLIGGLIGFFPILLFFIITAWGANFNPTFFLCCSPIFIIACSAFAFTQQEGKWKPLGTGLLAGHFGSWLVLLFFTVIGLILSRGA